MMHPYIYIGFFIPPEILQPVMERWKDSHLDRIIEHPHVTLAYRPETVDTSLFGTEARIRAVGYGNDGQNEGLLVEVDTDNPGLQELLQQVAVPHITLSVAADGKAEKTRYLNFRPIEPFEITARFGGFRRDRRVVTHR